MKNKMGVFILGLAIASMFLAVVPAQCFGEEEPPYYYADLRVEQTSYSLWPHHWRWNGAEIKNVGNWQADPTFYINIYFDVEYNSGDGMIALSRTLVEQHPHYLILYSQQSMNISHFYHWENPDPNHYRARFTVWADSTNKFNDEQSESDNWLSTPWFL